MTTWNASRQSTHIFLHGADNLHGDYEFRLTVKYGRLTLCLAPSRVSGILACLDSVGLPEG